MTSYYFFQNEAIYLFTEGTSIETCKEILKEKVSYIYL
jgi:hypothetical protein